MEVLTSQPAQKIEIYEYIPVICLDSTFQHKWISEVNNFQHVEFFYLGDVYKVNYIV